MCVSRSLQTGRARRPSSTALTLLFDFVFAFGAGNRVLDSLLRFGFFHGALGFGGAFGAGFVALLALLVENFFAAEEFDETHCRRRRLCGIQCG